MHLIVCIDDRDGISFAGRRLSTDCVLTKNIADMAASTKLWISPYSQAMFQRENVFSDPAYLEKAAVGEYCFLEKDIHLVPQARLESVILCRWNRAYPATEKFPRSVLQGMQLVDTQDFPGNSHDKITMERYCL